MLPGTKTLHKALTSYIYTSILYSKVHAKISIGLPETLELNHRLDL